MLVIKSDERKWDLGVDIVDVYYYDYICDGFSVYIYYYFLIYIF